MQNLFQKDINSFFGKSFYANDLLDILINLIYVDICTFETIFISNFQITNSQRKEKLTITFFYFNIRLSTIDIQILGNVKCFLSKII